MVFYDSPNRIIKTLTFIKETLGEVKISVAKELTKIHEEVLRMTLTEAVSYYAEHEPRGEFVLVLDGATPEQQEISLDDAVRMANTYLEQGMSPTTACKLASKETGVPKQEIYKALHEE